MANLVTSRFTSADLPALMDKISRNSIGLDEYFDRIFSLHETTSNYPPYNLIHLSNVESRLEIALAGFMRDEVHVYTEHGKLFVEGKREDKETGTQYIHKGLAQRSFKREWGIPDNVQVRKVTFENGLLVITIGKIVPEHHNRKDYL